MRTIDSEHGATCGWVGARELRYRVGVIRIEEGILDALLEGVSLAHGVIIHLKIQGGFDESPVNGEDGAGCSRDADTATSGSRSNDACFQPGGTEVLEARVLLDDPAEKGSIISGVNGDLS